jgi:putative endopeptidase
VSSLSALCSSDAAAAQAALNGLRASADKAPLFQANCELLEKNVELRPSTLRSLVIWRLEDALDEALLSMASFKAEAEGAALLARVVRRMAELLGLPVALAANARKHYAADEVAARADRVIALDGDYLRRLAELLARDYNRADLLAFLQYRAVRAASSLLSRCLDDEFFDLFGRKLGGRAKQQSAEKRALELVNEWTGELLGKAYVARHFSDADKTRVKEMVLEVIDAMRRSLQGSRWMSAPTKKNAIKKLSTFRLKLGFPDRWRSFDALDLGGADTLHEIARRVHAFELRTELAGRVNTPKDRERWHMPPQMVNAYYDPTSNEICFPAAILQAPFYYRSAAELGAAGLAVDDPSLADVAAAASFGGIGAVIAHEITHGFDDSGAKYDHAGNISNWWAQGDLDAFKRQCNNMHDQAARFVFRAEGGTEHTMNPDLCMGENLADCGGLALACSAMLNRLHNAETQRQALAPLANEAKRGKLLGLFEPKAVTEARAALDLHARHDAKLRKAHLQVLLESWAFVWRSKQTSAFAVQALAVDPHAPTSFRGDLVNNIDHFYEAFDVPVGAPMCLPKAKRVQMW